MVRSAYPLSNTLLSKDDVAKLDKFAGLQILDSALKWRTSWLSRAERDSRLRETWEDISSHKTFKLKK
jgi:hypothetical protein